MISTYTRGNAWQPQGKNMLMTYDEKRTKILYRLIVANAKQELAAFIKNILNANGRVGFVLAGHIIENSEGLTSATRHTVVDKSSALLAMCFSEEHLDDEKTPWAVWGCWLPCGGVK